MHAQNNQGLKQSHAAVLSIAGSGQATRLGHVPLWDSLWEQDKQMWGFAQRFPGLSPDAAQGGHKGRARAGAALASFPAAQRCETWHQMALCRAADKKEADVPPGSLTPMGRAEPRSPGAAATRKTQREHPQRCSTFLLCPCL